MSKKLRILIINGPNLNLLGTREAEIYGNKSLEDIKNLIVRFADEKDIKTDFFQSNSESEIINYLHKNSSADAIVINPAAFTHTSVAIRDAITAISIPAVEVHLSNIHAREEFRKVSFIAPVCIGQISGFGYNSYILGINAIMSYLSEGNN